MPHAASSSRLAHETSPYLRQHADNPVDWYPWGKEAIERARQLDRPIFLSIGYSACHWCHVMAHESFEDADVARILNDNFVSIKVDREERPDLDQIYMTAVQMLTGQGGWPMSVFLTPDLQPFYGGTYFPPDDRYGRPSFKRLLLALADAWKNRRDEVIQSSGQITDQLRLFGKLETSEGELNESLIRGAVNRLRTGFDSTYGGFGAAPKFPHPVDLRLLLRGWKRFGDDDALHMVRLTLDRMAMGGMYDHLGGGFHRYSTDRQWLVPHFEKMLYDNALLTVAYLEGYQAAQDPLYRQIVEETLAYVKREMTGPEGAFYSSQDADSEGEEGRYFVWRSDEVRKVLGPELASVFSEVYGVTEEGNWEDSNILNRSRTFAQEARLLNKPEPQLRGMLADAKAKLLEVRGRRLAPDTDQKTLAAWNALMIDAFARAATVLDSQEYAETAVRAADFILRRMRDPDGRLLRTSSSGSDPKLNAYLEDYAFFIEALVSLYEATFQPRWIASALELAEIMVAEFWDPAEAGFFFTGRRHEELIVRTKDPHDSSIPSGNSAATTALLRLAKLTDRRHLLEKAEATLKLFRGLMSQAPSAVGQMLIALDFYLGPVDEFAIVGDPSASETHRVLRAIHAGFRPNKVAALMSPAGDSKEVERLIPLLAGKTLIGPVTTYICRHFACQAPLVGADAVEAALASGKTG
jgi:uncharacterized protein YyaL (SSP411 family)